MSNRTSKHTLEQRLNAVLKIINGTHSINQVSNELRINSKTLSLWINKWQIAINNLNKFNDAD